MRFGEFFSGKKEQTQREKSINLDASSAQRTGWLHSVRMPDGDLSPDFKEWFGESVITTDGIPGGEPAVLYHIWRPREKILQMLPGGNDFDIEKTELGLHLGTADAARSNYGEKAKRIEGSLTIPVVVRMESPLYVRDLGSFSLQDKDEVLKTLSAYVAAERKGRGLFAPSQGDLEELKTVKDIHAWLGALGYDGIVYQNRAEGVSVRKGRRFLLLPKMEKAFFDSVIVFDPASQLRSAITGRPLIDGTGRLLFEESQEPRQDLS